MGNRNMARSDGISRRTRLRAAAPRREQKRTRTIIIFGHAQIRFPRAIEVTQFNCGDLIISR